MLISLRGFAIEARPRAVARPPGSPRSGLAANRFSGACARAAACARFARRWNPDFFSRLFLADAARHSAVEPARESEHAEADRREADGNGEVRIAEAQPDVDCIEAHHDE